MQDLTSPLSINSVNIHQFSKAFACSMLLAIAAQIQIPLSPVPVTLQTLAVLLIAILGGKRLGVMSVSIYLTEVAMSLPVLSGFKGGIPYLFGPTGGYLLGFIAASYFVGSIVEKRNCSSILNILLLCLIGSGIILACGTFYLSCFIGFPAAITMGTIPFLLGDLFKSIFATSVIYRQFKYS